MDTELLKAKETAFRVCGTTNLEMAFEQVLREREAMIELHGRNTRQALHIRNFDEILRTTSTIIAGIEQCGIMFMPTSVQNAIARYREQYTKIEVRLQEALKL